MKIAEVAYGSAQYEGMKALRYEILRKPINLELSEKDLRDEDRQIHIAALGDQGEVLGTVILMPLSEERVRLRQMSVAAQLQGQGVGAQLVKFAEEAARQRGFTVIETKARVTAQGFYEKLGYRVSGGDIFTEVTVHTIKMHKAL